MAATLPFAPTPPYRLVVLDFIRDHMRNSVVRNTFTDIVDLRQRCFMPANPRVLFMDALDLVSTHVALYDAPQDSSSPQLLGAYRIVHRKVCEEFALEFPLEPVLRHGDERHAQAYQNFCRQVEDPKTVGWLCIDPAARATRQTHALPLADFLVWSSSAYIRDCGANGLCALANSKFKMSRWIDVLGPCQSFADFRHPLIPDPHELMLIPQFDEDYQRDHRARYGALLDQAIYAGELCNFTAGHALTQRRRAA